MTTITCRQPHRPAAGRGRSHLGVRRPRDDQGLERDDRRPCRRDRAPRAQGAGSPLHVHHREDEWFYVIEGALAFWVGGEVIEAPAGSFVFGPRDIPHTFIVSSPEARFLLVTEPAGFEELHARGGSAGAVADDPAARGAPVRPRAR